MSNQYRVILVDDDTLVGNCISQGLTLLGHKVHYQSSIIALDVIINKFQPNIILLDVEIDDEDGIEYSKHIRTLFPNIPIIFISSHIDSSYVTRALNEGGVSYLKKPVDIEELDAYIKRFAKKTLLHLLSFGSFTLNTDSKVLTNTKNKHDIQLNNKETQLLELLINNIETKTYRKEILQKVWNNKSESSQSINNIISRLRNYLKEAPEITIETAPNEGYILKFQDK